MVDGLARGEAELADARLAVAAVGMGNPHAVVPVDDLDAIPFDAWGAALEVHPFFPAKTNVHFLRVHSRNRLEIRVWERGAGPTLACGTGACATLVAVLLGLSDDHAEVMLRRSFADRLAGSQRLRVDDRSGGRCVRRCVCAGSAPSRYGGPSARGACWFRFRRC